MRSTRDRIRHAIGFELIGLLIIIPLGSLAFHIPASDIGIVGIVSATIATIWNYLYNLGFDRLMRWKTGGTLKTPIVRVLHAILFEAGLLVILLPFMAWKLGISLTEALVMDIAFALFYVVYAFVFNWAYDRLFPLPEWQNRTA
ncbi:PACE efflux transporter [Neorhizobium alkalisoli]|uniref:Putative membrane protein n=1 Tax=Neorhizobium alkalisoli TaxID=528178 RepID=A0A561QRZ8_9HYPH|nr:PACE efflux transporter [Neorhizobium alkalisoli]TWF53171.1 putative membrane protein [Neorhizobium alkalisoli]